MKSRLETRKEILKKLKLFLEDKVEFAFLFGSAAKDSLREDSDIDCAVYLKNFSKSFHKFDFIMEISKNFERNVDIIFLNDADLIITMQVIANGELILDNNHRAFIEYKALKISQYLDYKISRKVIEDNLMNGRIYV